MQSNNSQKNNLKLPLTRGQEAMWFEWKINPNSTSYNTYVQLKLEGDIDPQRFCDAARDVVGYFDMLHSYFVEQNSEIFLQFSDQEYQLEYIDISDETGQESDEINVKLRSILDEKRKFVIDLTKFPLVNAALIKVADNVFYFTGIVPHIISDGASALYYLQAQSVMYNEGLEGFKNKYDETKKNWSEYIDLLKKQSEEKDQNEAIEYWKNNFDNANHKIEFSNAKTNILVSNEGYREKFTTSDENFKIMKKLAMKNRTSIFSVLSAFFSVFLSRFYNQNDVIMGYPVNLRPAGFRHAFGFFVNILPLRVEIPEDITFNELIALINKKRRQDKQYQYLSSLDIIKSKRSQDNKFDGLLFNTSIVETISRLQNLDIENVKSSIVEDESIEVHDDLSFVYELDFENVNFWFEYRKSLFEKQTIKDMVESMKYFIDQACQNPDKLLKDFEFVTEEKKKEILSLNKTSKYDSELNLHQYFEEMAKKFPNNLAIKDKNSSISYSDLNKLSNKIANYLVENGVKTGDRVAIILERSQFQLASILAILKTGACYIPLDINYPQERIKYIIDEANCNIAICEKDFGLENIKIINEIDKKSKNYDENNLNLEISKDNLAYIIFTSGSTGKPKGVMISHDSISKRIKWLKNDFVLSEKDKMLQNTKYVFDVSVAEIFWPLASGSALILSDEEKSVDAKYLINLINDNQISVSCIVPSVLNILVKNSDDSDLQSLKKVISAGEALPTGLIKDFYQLCQNSELYNFYGPTEATIYSTWCKCEKDQEISHIGKPVDNIDSYILTDNLKLAPIGSISELYLGSDSLATGYLNRQDLTDENFINNPFSSGKLYKTGDLACYLEDGSIQYLGRKDSQIKLRGYRIELEEINNIYLKIIKEGDLASIIQDNNRIVLFYEGTKIDDGELKKFGSKYLPNYMIPNNFVNLKQIPRLESGKINLKSLALIKDFIKQEKIKPLKTKKEKEIAKIFAKVLRIDKKLIGLNSSFFELGGDSLMLIELSCALEEINIFIEPHELFVSNDIENIIKDSRDYKIEKSDQSLITGEFNLLPRHNKFFSDNIISQNHWNRMMMVEFKQNINLDYLQESINQILTHHDGLRISFQKSQDKIKILNHDDGLKNKILEFDLCDLKKDKQDQEIIDILNKENKFNSLSEAPLFKILSFKISKKKTIIAFIIHHLLIDMRSMRILLEDLVNIYKSLILKIPHKLPPKTTSLKEYSQELDKSLSIIDDSILKYWKESLNQDKFKIPYDNDSNSLKEKNQEHKNFNLSKKESEKIIKNKDIATDEFLLSSFAKSYKKWSKSDDLIVNTCSHGRDKLFNNVDLSRTIGWVNTVFPFKINLNDSDLNSQIKDNLKFSKSNSLSYIYWRFSKKNKDLQAQEPKIFFNYVSKIDTNSHDKLPINLIENPKEVNIIDPEENSSYVIYIEIGIIEDKISVNFSYDKSLFKEENIAKLIEYFKLEMKNI